MTVEEQRIFTIVKEQGIEPYDTAESLHIYEEMYLVDGKPYSFFYTDSNIPDCIEETKVKRIL